MIFHDYLSLNLYSINLIEAFLSFAIVSRGNNELLSWEQLGVIVGTMRLRTNNGKWLPAVKQ